MNKSNNVSNNLRLEGNEHYKKRQFFQALLKYNQSLCFSEEKTGNLGLAYANRSAVYFEIKLYDECLKNIDLALKNYYPKKDEHILESRKTKCKELIKKKQMSRNENIFKISLPVKKSNPFIASCLKLECNENYGRHIVTTHDLHVGDVIAVQTPFCCIPISESHFVKVTEDNIYQRCNNCLKSLNLNLIPCNKCCYAMFCSPKCHDFATKYYHHYECPIMFEILKSGSSNMTLRIFFMSLSVFNEEIGKLKEFFEETLKHPKNVFDFDLSFDDYSDGMMNQLKCVLSLAKSDKTYPMTLQRHILSTHPVLQTVYKENQEFIDAFILHQCQIINHSIHGIFSSNLSTESFNNTNLKSLQEPVGSGIFLFASLINHSCAPNIMRICVDGEIYIIVCREILKGSQIFDCYKSNFMMENREYRQANLLKEFNFTCQCEACMENWPTARNLTVKNMKLMKYAKKINDELIETFANEYQLMKLYKNCKNILQENNKDYPCMELCVTQKILATILLKFAAQNHFQF